MASRLRPFYDLLGKYVEWNWTDQCQQVIEASKTWIVKALVLTQYDPKKPLIVASDAYQYGVGAMLVRKIKDGSELPICFASKTMSGIEKNYYSAAERGLEHYISIYVIHRSLATSSHLGPTKDVPYLATSWLQKWALLLYDVQYWKGQEMGNVDVLSRLQLPQSEPLEHPIYSVSTMPNATEENHILRELKKYILHRWPAEIEEKLKPYLNKKDEIAVDRGCLMWGDRIIIPLQLTKEVLQMLHGDILE
ncbi:hypothetical protein PR048_018395 [Dryococelus australis]|uniref:Reverse transcriptase/retrotransposon-derived protein RNase H-like domain-containing protein n=1 Tax=Dryococelus australis TaxID=614101 RepID=A0ABQ9HCB4_9NEOP|nr:hypothetical protein PR048_018395 [Dryococelus australis]